MFYPMVNNKAALIFMVAQVMPQGTGVKYDPANPGFVIPDLAGMNVIGLTAQEVIDYNNRPREYDMAPELFTGRAFDPVMINRPGALAIPAAAGAQTPGLQYPSGLTDTTHENAGTNVGVWCEPNSLFQCRIVDEATGADVGGLLPGQALVIGALGVLSPAKAVGETRPTIARVHAPGNGVGVPLPINTTVPTYVVRLTSAVAL